MMERKQVKNKIFITNVNSMQYSLERSYEILDRTPAVLNALLSGLPDDWVMPNEGPETFSPYDVVGHFIHGEKTDWVVRAKMILQFGMKKVKANPYNSYSMNLLPLEKKI
jgi:hypothetical protein